MTLGSLFDGSGGFPLAATMCDITPVWASEIEPFPIMVTTKRFPNMKHYGDVSKIDGSKVEPVDIITFGSPCQDLSIAGKRAGLDDGERSNLFYQAIRIIKEMRKATNGKYPRWAIWENVPGAFSSNEGEDFRAVIETMCNVNNDGKQSISIPKPEKWENSGSIVGDSYSVAWRVLDAQYWGVPQRRKRIFLVADFDSGHAPKVLFESDGMSRYSAEGFRTWQRLANGVKGCIGETSGTRNTPVEPLCVATTQANAEMCVNKSPTISAHPTLGGPYVCFGFDGYNQSPTGTVSKGLTNKATDSDHVPIVFENHSQDSRVTISKNGKVQTLASNMGMGGNNVPLVASVKKEDTPKSMLIRCGKEGGGKGALISDNKAHTVTAVVPQTLFQPVSYGMDRAAYNQGKNAKFDFSVDEEQSPTIVAKGPGAVVHPVISTSKVDYHTKANYEVTSDLVATDYKDPPTVVEPIGFYPQMKAEAQTPLKNISPCLVNGTNPGFQNGVVEPSYLVRRLTPVECARLQGFPDCWCSNLGTKHPTEEDIEYWQKIWDVWSDINGNPHKTQANVLRWIKQPYTDAAEYKMWGNGVALPCVFFIMAGIEWANTLPIEETKPIEKLGQVSIFDL